MNLEWVAIKCDLQKVFPLPLVLKNRLYTSSPSKGLSDIFMHSMAWHRRILEEYYNPRNTYLDSRTEDKTKHDAVNLNLWQFKIIVDMTAAY